MQHRLSPLDVLVFAPRVQPKQSVPLQVLHWTISWSTMLQPQGGAVGVSAGFFLNDNFVSHVSVAAPARNELLLTNTAVEGLQFGRAEEDEGHMLRCHFLLWMPL